MANLSVEANFGDNLSKPFKYKIDCPAMVLEFEELIKWERMDEHEKPIECLVCCETFPLNRMFFCNAPTAQQSFLPHYSHLTPKIEETDKPGPSSRLLYQENKPDQGLKQIFYVFKGATYLICACRLHF
jgi:hypothetical protein